MLAAATLWDVLAIVAQLSGVQAAMLLAEALSLLRIPQCARERAELERSACKLRVLLDKLRAITGGETVAQHPEMKDLVSRALDDADGLIGSYDGSTLWRRLRTGRTMAGQLRDMHDRVDSCCVLVLFAHASYVLTQSIVPPPSDAATINQGNVGSAAAVTRCPTATSAETSTAADCTQRMMNSVDREGLGCQTDNTEPKCEFVTTIMISNA